jgi:hypothetical protein
VMKTETNGGNTVQIFDNNYYFKVTRWVQRLIW